MIGFISPRVGSTNIRTSPSIDATIAGVVRGIMLCEWYEAHKAGDWQRIKAEDPISGAVVVGFVHANFVTLRESSMLDRKRFIDLAMAGEPTIALDGDEHVKLVNVFRALINYLEYEDGTK